MIIAIISDIHGNLEALEKALELIDQVEVDEVLCLGDVVGYGADPNECIDRVRSRCSVVLLGNHDAAAVGLTSVEYFNTHARRAAFWTRDRLTEENTEYIRSLPLEHRTDYFLAVHASPHEMEEWHYVTNQGVADDAFAEFEDPVCFIGHSHVPILFREGGARGERLTEGTITLPEKTRSIVNVGSVGQPRDNDSRLSFGVYDSEKRTVTIRREKYDVAAASEKILRAGLPEMLATRLHLGV